jgi:hypothetical protein
LLIKPTLQGLPKLGDHKPSSFILVPPFGQQPLVVTQLKSQTQGPKPWDVLEGHPLMNATPIQALPTKKRRHDSLP